LGFSESAVKTLAKFGEVAIEMHVFHPMVYTTDIALDIGNKLLDVFLACHIVLTDARARLSM